MVSILPEGCSVYAIDISKFFDANTSFAIEPLAALCLRLIRKNQEHGPYYFCGYSLGGVVAYEAATRLANEGEEIRLLALFDTPNPAFISKLSAAAAMQSRKRYLSDRLKKYGRNLRLGNFGGFTGDALGFLNSRVGEFPWLMVRATFRLLNRPMPPILRNNDPMFSAALRAYIPKPYGKRLMLFCSESAGPEYDIDSTLGWGSYVIGGIDVYVVPGGHVSMMARPQFLVDKLAANLDDCPC
jgi:thioesterase domain-containing protein